MYTATKSEGEESSDHPSLNAPHDAAGDDPRRHGAAVPDTQAADPAGAAAPHDRCAELFHAKQGRLPFVLWLTDATDVGLAGTKRVQGGATHATPKNGNMIESAQRLRRAFLATASNVDSRAFAIGPSALPPSPKPALFLRRPPMSTAAPSPSDPLPCPLPESSPAEACATARAACLPLAVLMRHASSKSKMIPIVCVLTLHIYWRPLSPFAPVNRERRCLLH